MRIIPIRALAALSALLLAACGSSTTEEPTTTSTVEDRPIVAVTYSVLGSIVADLVGDAADVVVVIPDGQDPHDYQPSAKDVETLNNSALIVANGLGLEEGLESVLEAAERSGVTVFHVADHVTVRESKDDDHKDHDDDHDHDEDHDHDGEGGGVTHEGGHHDHDGDPHLWISPATLLEALPALAVALETAIGAPVALASVSAALEEVDAEVAAKIGALESCVLVTGHDELGYYADRYGCEVVGTIIPSMSTTAEASAKQLAALKAEIAEHGVAAIFTSVGTPDDVAAQIARETGVRVVVLATHMLGTNATYAGYIVEVTDTIVAALS